MTSDSVHMSNAMHVSFAKPTSPSRAHLTENCSHLMCKLQKLLEAVQMNESSECICVSSQLV